MSAEDVETLVYRGQNMRQAGNLAAAEALCAKARELAPDSPSAFELDVDIHMHRKDFDGVADLAEERLAQHPRCRTSALMQVLCNVERGQMGYAKDAVAHFRDIHSDDPGFCLDLELVYMSYSGNLPRVQELLTKVREENTASLLDLQEIELKATQYAGKVEAAARHTQSMLENGRIDWHSLFQSAFSSLMMGRPLRAWRNARMSAEHDAMQAHLSKILQIFAGISLVPIFLPSMALLFLIAKSVTKREQGRVGTALPAYISILGLTFGAGWLAAKLLGASGNIPLTLGSALVVLNISWIVCLCFLMPKLMLSSEQPDSYTLSEDF